MSPWFAVDVLLLAAAYLMKLMAASVSQYVEPVLRAVHAELTALDAQHTPYVKILEHSMKRLLVAVPKS